MSFPILFDQQNVVAEQFGVQGMPSSVFVDRAGNVRYLYSGYLPRDEAKYSYTVLSLATQ